MANVYLLFLHLVEELDCSVSTYTLLDEVSKKLLEVIAAKHYQNKAISVGEAMKMHQIASPYTVHRKLRELLEAGWIHQVFEGKNRRTKYLIPTGSTIEYFAQLDLLIEQAIQQHQRLSNNR